MPALKAHPAWDAVRNAGFTDLQIARLLNRDRSSVSRWRSTGSIPPHLARILAAKLEKRGHVAPPLQLFTISAHSRFGEGQDSLAAIGQPEPSGEAATTL